MTEEASAVCGKETRQLVGREIFRNAIKGNFKDAPIEKISVELISKCDWAEVEIYEMMNRYDILGKHTYNERKRAFHYLVAFWQDVIEKETPSIIYFSSTPHEIVDFALYLVAHANGIKTPMWQDAHSLKRKILTLGWKRPWELPFSIPANPSVVNPIDGKGVLAKYLGPYSAAEPFYNKKASLRRNLNLAQKTAARIKSGLNGLSGSIINRFGIYRESLETYRGTFRVSSVFAFVTVMAQVFSDLLEFSRVATESRLAEKFLKLNEIHELPQTNYITFFLHYQPEMTVVPMGRVKGDQYLAILELSRSIPEDWIILVREHPTQYARDQAGYLTGRDSSFYERILAIPKTKLISNKLDAFALIDGAWAVSTISGTAGWESIARGNWAILFGECWYSTAPGALNVGIQNSCSEAIQEILGGKPRNYEQKLIGYLDSVLLMASDVQFSKSLANSLDVKWDPVSYETNLKSHLGSAFENIFGKSQPS